MIKVLIIDDSALVRNLLTEIFKTDPVINVVGTAANPNIARRKIKQLNPDVLTLDIEMPEMSGLSFLENLMRLRPMPVLMVSTLTDAGSDMTLKAMELGAVDFICKPKVDFKNTIYSYADELISKVKMVAKVNVHKSSFSASSQVIRSTVSSPKEKYSADVILKKSVHSKPISTTNKLIAIGASTGGTEAIRAVLRDFPIDSPGVVITQHIPVTFSGTFASRLNDICAITVKEATDGEEVLDGHAYVAPGDQHLLVEQSKARFICRLNDGPLVNRHKPSVDVLFRSIAQNIGPNVVAVILTGMGNDGAAGLKEIHETGARTIAQDEESSIVWGMPGEAVKLGAADEVLSLSEIAAATMRNVNQLQRNL